MYSYEEALEASIKYFNGNELAAKVWLDKYALRDNEDNILEFTPDDTHRRLAREFARIEKSKFKEPLTEDEIYYYFKEFSEIIPQGSPMYGIGNPYKYVTLSNCYLLTCPLDSYSSILETDKQLVNIAKRRGGNGIDLDNIRPAGTPTKNSARTSTGIVPFMERYSNSTREVGQNSRRGACMMTLSVHHPQILDFINAKQDKTKVTGANISVKLTNEFLQAVKDNTNYEQRWPLNNPSISKMVSAKKIWDELIKNAWECFSGDTQLWVMEHGEPKLLEIQDLCTNFHDKYQILSYNQQSGKLEFKPILKAHKTLSVHDMYKIKVSNVEVKVTANHEFFVLDGQNIVKKQAKNLTLDDKVVFAKHMDGLDTTNTTIDLTHNLEPFNKHGWYATGGNIENVIKKYKLYQYSKFVYKKVNVTIENGLPIKRILKHNVPIKEIGNFNMIEARTKRIIPSKYELDSDLCMFFGLWVAEGSLTNNCVTIHINVNEWQYYESLIKIICSRFGCSYKSEIDGNYLRVDLHSSLLNKLLSCIFTRQKDISIIASLSNKFIGDFLNGFISGDGTIEQNAIVLAQSNKDRIQKVQNLLARLGIFSKIMKKSNGGQKTIRGKLSNFKPEYKLYVISAFNDLFKNKVGLLHTEKFNKIQSKISYSFSIPSDFITENSRSSVRAYVGNARYYQYSHLQSELADDFINSDFYLPKITLIEKITSEQYVYDITVKDNHSLVLANGIVSSNCAEPGLLFFDNILKESPADCYGEFGFETRGTNPCSELPLSELDSCRLMVINLFSCVVNPFTKNATFDYDKLTHLAKITQRLMDDMVDLELEAIERVISKIQTDPEPQSVKQAEIDMWNKIHQNCRDGRRTGTGITAIGDVLAALGLKYDSDESIQVVEEIYRTIKLGAYTSSVDMAKEIGSFRYWDHQLEKNNPFLLRIKSEDETLWTRMKKYGRRNIALLTTAPTGSISIMAKIGEKFGTTSGIEPCFKDRYIRRKKGNPGDNNFHTDFVDQSGDHWQEFEVYHSGLEEFIRITGKSKEGSPYNGSCAEELDWRQRVKLQAAAQKHVDHAISSTINLPNNATIEQVAQIYKTAWEAGCKGMTVYRDGCRTGVLVAKETKENKQEKRPKSIPCDVYHISVNKNPYLVFVGIHNGPYEVMAIKNGFVPKSVKTGTTTKIKRGIYQCELDNGQIIDNIVDNAPEEEALTRMISTALRHGAEIAFIVHQLEKTRGDMTSFAKCIARALKKYIPDDTEVHGEECPQCNSSLVRSEGCLTCKSCGFSKCN